MTIISNRRKFIFVHVPKCGGTSVERAYARHAKIGDMVIGSTRRGEFLQRYYRRFTGLHKHNSARSLREILGQARWDGYTTAAVVRHPERIMESYYKWADKLVKRHMRRRQIGIEEVRRNLEQDNHLAPFYAWWNVARFIRVDRFQEYVAESLRAGMTIVTVDFTSDQDGRQVVDHVLRLEELDEVTDLLREVTGAPDLRIGHDNAGSQISDLEWDARDLQRFREVNREAYTRFGYEFDRDTRARATKVRRRSLTARAVGIDGSPAYT